MILALIIGVLFGGSVYLMLQRDRLRVILGFVLLGHACNLLIFSAGGTIRRDEPLGAGPDPAVTADPLPQAFVLTAIVIAFAITVYLLVLAVTGSRDEDLPDETTPEGTGPAPVGTLEDRYDEFGEPAGTTDPYPDDPAEPAPAAEPTSTAESASAPEGSASRRQRAGTRAHPHAEVSR